MKGLLFCRVNLIFGQNSIMGFGGDLHVILPQLFQHLSHALWIFFASTLKTDTLLIQIEHFPKNSNYLHNPNILLMFIQHYCRICTIKKRRKTLRSQRCHLSSQSGIEEWLTSDKIETILNWIQKISKYFPLIMNKKMANEFVRNRIVNWANIELEKKKSTTKNKQTETRV